MTRQTMGIAPMALLVTALASGETRNAAREKMKTLASEWEGTTSYGPPTAPSYRPISNGTALVETLPFTRKKK